MDMPLTQASAAQGGEAPIKVWDLPVRLFHWSLLAAVAIAAITGWLLRANWLGLHLVAGSAVAALVLFRLIWGFTGSTYSRFTSFIYPPSAVLEHIKGIREGHAEREAGHNPLGALMVFALLAVLASLVVTGTLLLGGAFKQGPLKSFVSFATGWQAREYHELIAYGLLALVAAHFAGAIFESKRTAENLAASMVTGRKRGGFAHALRDRPANSVVAGAAVVLFAVVGVGSVYELSQRAPMGVPAFTANPAWAKECAACHIAFHPSLLPADSWSKVMDDLSNHFGEDASLDEAATAEIKAFLVANAAETRDTLPANRLRKVDPAKPLEITATPFWTRMHGDIPAALFTAKPVGAKQNCAACHADAATGMFAPQSIDIPEETTK
jgi:cytochrome b